MSDGRALGRTPRDDGRSRGGDAATAAADAAADAATAAPSPRSASIRRGEKRRGDDGSALGTAIANAAPSVLLPGSLWVGGGRNGSTRLASSSIDIVGRRWRKEGLVLLFTELLALPGARSGVGESFEASSARSSTVSTPGSARLARRAPADGDDLGVVLAELVSSRLLSACASTYVAAGA